MQGTGANSILFATVPSTLAEYETEKWNRAKKLNVRYVLKNPDTAKTQTQVLKLNKKKPSSLTLKVKG